jgi:hypothetical protein
MRCPHCLTSTAVAETRDATSVRWAGARELATRYPDAILRRRVCSAHGSIRTIELPLDDFLAAANAAQKA